MATKYSWILILFFILHRFDCFSQQDSCSHYKCLSIEINLGDSSSLSNSSELNVLFINHSRSSNLLLQWFDYLPYLSINKSVSFDLFILQGNKSYLIKKTEHVIPVETERNLVLKKDSKVALKVNLNKLRHDIKKINNNFLKEDEKIFLYAVYEDKDMEIKIISNMILCTLD